MRQKIIAAMGAIVVIASCDKGRDDSFENDPRYGSPIHLTDAIAYVSNSFGIVQLVRVDAGSGRPEVLRVEIGANAWKALPSGDGSRLFVICHGAREGEVRQSEVEKESLHVIEAATGTSQVYLLDSPFTDIAESKSGRWVLAYFESMVAGTNPNLISVVDLDEEPSPENPGSISIRTLGSIPLGIVVAERMDVLVEREGADALVEKNLALVLSNSYITLFDLDHLERSEITVPLVVPSSGVRIVPIEKDVIISNDGSGHNTRIVMRSDSSSDIFSTTLVGLEADGPLANDYRVSFNQLSVDVNPHDAPTGMSSYTKGGTQKILVTTRTSDTFAVVDPGTTTVTTVEVDVPVETSLVFDDGRKAFLYSTGQSLGYFVDLTSVEIERERSLDVFAFGGRLQSFVPVPNKDFVVMMLTEEPGKLFVLDLAGRQMAMINLFESSWDATFLMYPDGNRIILDPGGQDEIWFVSDMSSFVIDRIILDEAVVGVSLMPAASRIVLDHGSAGGYLTFVDMDEPRRSTAKSVRGFLLGDVMSLGTSGTTSEGDDDE